MKRIFILLLLWGSICSAQTFKLQTQELPNPVATDLDSWKNVKPGLQASFASTDLRFEQNVVPNISVAKKHKLTAWKNEKVHTQLVLWSIKDTDKIDIKVGDFIGKSQKLPASIAKVNVVKYVMTDEFAGGCGHRKPENFAASLSADILEPSSSVQLMGHTVRPFWIQIQVPAQASEGHYISEISIGENQKFTLELEVQAYTLPEPKDWKYHLDLWQHPAAVARVEGLELWSDAHFKALEKVMKPLAQAGQKVITATLNKDPWNVQTQDPYAEMILWTKQKDGNWVYNYEVFDRWVEFMHSLGINKMINCYSIVPWNNEIQYRDEASQQIITVKTTPGTPIFEELWTPFLQDFSRHLKTKGWLYKTQIALDERSREEMDAALKLLQKVAPDLGISYADNQKTYQRFPNSNDISISVGHPFDKKDLIDRQSRGLNTTFYICCSDGFPNVFTFSDPAEATYLAWYALASGFDGMLRWAYNSWVTQPLQDSRFRTWPAGDTYVVYPGGRSSIRFERMVEGIQDYEKVQVLMPKLAKADKERLQKVIQALGVNKRIDGWNQRLNEAKQLLNELYTR